MKRNEPKKTALALLALALWWGGCSGPGRHSDYRPPQATEAPVEAHEAARQAFSVERFSWSAPLPSLEEEGYPLDATSRVAPTRGALQCPDVQILPYGGDVLSYHRPVEVNPFFRERLQQFEAVVARVAHAHYGRAPRRIVHWGGHNCRRVRSKRHKLSEHALGNAIDVAGFDFGPMEGGGGDHPLDQAFTVRLQRDWDVGSDGLHARFLRALVVALSERPDIFRTMLGPAYPGHDDHFHFDCAPRWYMKI